MTPTFQVYVRLFAPEDSSKGGKWLVWEEGGYTPRWARNGLHLFYQAGLFLGRNQLQNRNFRASCTIRGGPAVATFPNVEVPTVSPTDPGCPKNGVFVKLKNSERN
jgi:hypothetical protein